MKMLLKKGESPNTRCEVCGNEINQRSLIFYKEKYNRNKKKVKGNAKKWIYLIIFKIIWTFRFKKSIISSIYLKYKF